MKKNLLLFGILVLAAAPALAEVDVNTLTEPYYLRNSNYSSEAIRLIQLDKHYANGIPVAQNKKVKYSDNKFLNATAEAVHAAFRYWDPAFDDGKYFTRDIDLIFGFDDL